MQAATVCRSGPLSIFVYLAASCQVIAVIAAVTFRPSRHAATITSRHYMSSPTIPPCCRQLSHHTLTITNHPAMPSPTVPSSSDEPRVCRHQNKIGMAGQHRWTRNQGRDASSTILQVLDQLGDFQHPLLNS